MPRFVKDGLTIETAVPRESADLRAQGFKEQKARTAAVREADAVKVESVEASPAAAAKPEPAKSK